jgi:cellulose synthase/poly-beta-1,6-N-acetylglucosamine synthase-like glycosyltransferase
MLHQTQQYISLKSSQNATRSLKCYTGTKKTGGIDKAAAINAGLKRATGEIVLCFDADYYPQRDIVEKLVREFVDPSVGAVQGRPVVWNEAQNAVTRLVTLERIGGYRVDQKPEITWGLSRNLAARPGALGEAFWKIWAVLTSLC